MAIPFNDLRLALEPIRKDIDRAIASVVDSGIFVNGPNVEKFEEAWAEYCGAERCVTYASGTAALAAIGFCLSHSEKAVQVDARTIPNTMIGLQQGGVDVVPTDDIVAFHVGLYGEYLWGPWTDACQMHGCKFGGEHPQLAAWSFYPTKNLGAIGEGGAVTVIDRTDYQRCLSWRTLSTSRMREVEAAALNVKLPHLDGWNACRKSLAACYWECLSVPPVVEVDAGNHHLMAVLFDNRESVQTALTKNDIGWKVHYPTPLHIWEGGESRRGECPNAEWHCEHVLSLPIYPGMTKEQVRTVCDVVNGAL